MKLKWSKAETKYFSKKIPVAERDYSWIIWSIMAICSLTGMGYWIWTMIR